VPTLSCCSTLIFNPPLLCFFMCEGVISEEKTPLVKKQEIWQVNFLVVINKRHPKTYIDNWQSRQQPQINSICNRKLLNLHGKSTKEGKGMTAAKDGKERRRRTSKEIQRRKNNDDEVKDRRRQTHEEMWGTKRNTQWRQNY
jgi:hypothetical protein